MNFSFSDYTYKGENAIKLEFKNDGSNCWILPNMMNIIKEILN